MKRFLILLAVIFLSFSSDAFARGHGGGHSHSSSGYTHGYTRSNGTYVHGYHHSARDGTVTNNYSYKGNVNPYTGKIGTNKYEHDVTSPYYTGPDSHGNIGHENE